jgi:hypothetical protein
MSTRAVIATQTYDRGILATYLHFDGYPEHVLPILTDRYLDPDKAIELIEGGELRSLQPTPEEPEYFENSRRTEELKDESELDRLAHFLNAEHIYFYDDMWRHRKV